MRHLRLCTEEKRTVLYYLLFMFRSVALSVRNHWRHRPLKCVIQYGGGGMTVVGVSYLLLHRKDNKLSSIIGGTSRFTRSFAIGVTISMDYWIASFMDHNMEDVHKRSANRIAVGCLQNGGIYIKLGQGLAMINHILPKEYVDALTILQDKCLTRKRDEVEEMFIQDFGKKPEELFKNIELEPVAAASLAQVYKGETLNGDAVAIKVQYMNLRERFHSDIKTLQFLLKIVTVIHPKFNLHWVLDEVFDTLSQELDFRIEGRNSEKCSQDLKKFNYAYVPKVYWDLSTDRILTMEWIDGIKINDVKRIQEEGLDIADVDKKLISVMAEQIFHTGFVHGDPHPGNVFVRKGHDGKAQIVLLDHGLYEYVPEKTRVSLCNFWESMVLRDDSLLKVYAKEFNVDDYTLLAEMVTQAPYSISVIAKGKMDGQTAQEYMEKQAKERFDSITAALRSMPKSMLLVIRNLNTVRAITKDHGDIVDRYRIMAKTAVSGKYNVTHRSLVGRVSQVVNKAKFETHLWYHSLLQFIFKVYFSILQFFGYDVNKVLEVAVM